MTAPKSGVWLSASTPTSEIDAIGGYPELSNLPEDWFGMALEWEEDYQPTPVFLGKVDFDRRGLGGDVGETTAFVFGFKIELAMARCAEASLPNGHFLSFIVVETRPDQDVVRHVLKQTESVTYSASPEVRDYEIAAEMTSKVMPCLAAKPSWKPEDGYWPKENGVPMHFLKQWRIPRSEAAQVYFVASLDVFLFAAFRSNRELAFKITTQVTGDQTAEDHYRDEELSRLGE